MNDTSETQDTDDFSLLFQGFEEHARRQEQDRRQELSAYAEAHLEVHPAWDERRQHFRGHTESMRSAESIGREVLEWARLAAAAMRAGAAGIHFRAPADRRVLIEGVHDPEALLEGGGSRVLKQVIERMGDDPGRDDEFAAGVLASGEHVGLLVQRLLTLEDAKPVGCGFVWLLKRGPDGDAISFRPGHVWLLAALARDWNAEIGLLAGQVDAGVAAAAEPAQSKLAELDPQLIERIEAQQRTYERDIATAVETLCAGEPLVAAMFGARIAMSAEGVVALLDRLRAGLRALDAGLQRLPGPDEFLLRLPSSLGMWSLEREPAVREVYRQINDFVRQDALHRHVFEHASALVGAALWRPENHPGLRRGGLNLNRAGHFAAREMVRLGVEQPVLVRLLGDVDDTAVVTSSEPRTRRNLMTANLYETLVLAAWAATVLEQERAAGSRELAPQRVEALAPLLRRLKGEYRHYALFLLAVRSDRSAVFELAPELQEILGCI